MTIPRYSITTEKKSLVKALGHEDSLVLKTLHPGLKYQDKEVNHSYLLTKRIKRSVIPDRFFPSFVLQEIKKVFEVRIFVFNNQYFGMAIFSQMNPRTSLDFKNHDPSHPNRISPFKIPQGLKKNIRGFMKIAQIDTGSFDFIYSQDGKFYFLEVNTSGQLEWLSQNCNYNIEENIAEFIFQKMKNNDRN